MNHLAQFVLIHRVRNRSLEHRWDRAARVAQQTLSGKLPGESRALHIERFAAAATHWQRLRINSSTAAVADGQRDSTQQRPVANTAVGGKYGGEQIVKRGKG
jgi:hypothetical protein